MRVNETVVSSSSRNLETMFACRGRTRTRQQANPDCRRVSASSGARPMSQAPPIDRGHDGCVTERTVPATTTPHTHTGVLRASASGRTRACGHGNGWVDQRRRWWWIMAGRWPTRKASGNSARNIDCLRSIGWSLWSGAGAPGVGMTNLPTTSTTGVRPSTWLC
ncbi:hypothetical protein BS78_10G235800 [Paspalum vaginatum]|nr:hypothetical protein BS78_10G235800 [Paspalum vaginatum]